MNKENSNVENMNNQEVSMQSMTVQTKQKRGNKRRVMLLIILLICTVALLGGATYAWFTANTLVSVDTMRLHVTTANGIQISSDAQAWGIVMTKYDLYKAGGFEVKSNIKTKAEDAGAINQFPAALKNVSTIGNIFNKDATGKVSKMEIFNGTAGNVCWVGDADTGSLKELQKGTASSAGTAKPTDCNSDILPATQALLAGTVTPYEYENYSCIGGADAQTTLTETELNGVLQAATSATGNTAANKRDCAEKIAVMSFDMYLKLDADSRVSLAAGSSVKAVNADNGLKNTVRVAFVTLGTQPAIFYDADYKDIRKDDDVANNKYIGQLADTAWGNDADHKQYEIDYKTNNGFTGKYGARIMNTFGSVKIWEPNALDHTRPGIDNARNNYDMDEDDVIGQAVATHGVYKVPDASETWNMDGVNSPISIMPMLMNRTNNTKNPKYFAPQVSSDTTTTQSGEHPFKNAVTYKQTTAEESEESFPIFDAPAGVTKVRVYIWIEGADIDTENNATANDANVTLMFTTADTTDDLEFETYNYTEYGTEAKDNYVWRNGTPTSVSKYKLPTPKTTATATS